MSEHFRKQFPKNSQLVKFRTSFHNTVYDVLRSRGWREWTEDEVDEKGRREPWHVFWCDKDWIYSDFDTTHLLPYQKVNHFRNHYEMTRKDLLVKNLKRCIKQAMKDNDPKEAAKFQMYPATFVLPLEYSLFVEEFKKSYEQAKADKQRCVWIMKPIGKAQGKGTLHLKNLKS